MHRASHDSPFPPTCQSFHPGFTLGDAVGDHDGLPLGEVEGLALGDADGATLGLTLGLEDGDALGLTLGLSEGDPLGMGDGASLGDADGLVEGDGDGLVEGLADGTYVGLSVGEGVGLFDGLIDWGDVNLHALPTATRVSSSRGWSRIRSTNFVPSSIAVRSCCIYLLTISIRSMFIIFSDTSPATAALMTEAIVHSISKHISIRGRVSASKTGSGLVRDRQ